MLEAHFSTHAAQSMDYFLAMSLNMVGSDMGIKILMENKIFFYAAQHERKQRIKINPASGIGLQPKGGGKHLAMKP